MERLFGGCRIVHFQEFPEGTVVEIDPERKQLWAKTYVRLNKKGTEYDYDKECDVKIGYANDFFYDKNTKRIKRQSEIIAMITHKLLYEIGVYPINNVLYVDKYVDDYYEECPPYLIED